MFHHMIRSLGPGAVFRCEYDMHKFDIELPKSYSEVRISRRRFGDQQIDNKMLELNSMHNQKYLE